ncbi:C7orf50 family protein [Megaselia abdita]
MALNECPEVQKKTAKKRKSDNEDDDPAEKNIILERPDDTKPAKKRKQPKADSTTAPKRVKNSDDEKSGAEDEQPTAEQLKESEKPENKPDIQTVREKKKKRHQKNVVMQKESSENKEVSKNKEYLTKWKNDKDHWKFEKLRQISIQSLCLDQSKMDDEVWEIAVDYLSGTKGAAKAKLCEMAEKTIEKLDEEIQKTQDKSLISSASYKRSRELLQSLD